MNERTKETEVREYFFEDDGRIPNNPTLPLLVYPQALEIPSRTPRAARNCSRRTVGEARGWMGSSPIITP